MLARETSSNSVSLASSLAPCSVLTPSSSETFDNKTSNSVFWSPKGRHVLITTLGSNSKFDIEFWDLDLDRDGEKTDDKDAGGGIRLLSTVEHYGVTDIEWDPSGRFVATSASTWMSSVSPLIRLFPSTVRYTHTSSYPQMEAGYALWDFKGAELQKHNLDKFKQLLWRPRPPTLLTKEDQKRIRKNLRDYSRQFEEQDQLDAMNVSEELVALRKRLIEEWNSWRRAGKEEVERMREDLGKLVVVEPSKKEEELEIVEEWVEEVISETFEVVA
jgi:translation initiation factor 3 subunit B